jgi:hypothetical protein
MAEFTVVTNLDLLKFALMNRSRQAEHGCWEWMGSTKNGYGQFECHGLRFLARKSSKRGSHQVSYEAFNGHIPKGQVVRHTCDNSLCINPDHLILGTQADNVADREARGRRKGINGEMIGTSRLTAAQVLEIRASDLSYAQLAEKYGVDKSTIYCVKTGKSWKHLICVDTQKVG